MFSRRPRKQAPPRQRPQSARRKPARKRAGKRARSKGKTRRAGARGRRKAGRRHSPLFAFIFWPFLIINRLLAKWPGVVRIPAKGICYLACGASSIFILAALLSFLRSLSYEMGQVAVMPQRSITLGKREMLLSPMSLTSLRSLRTSAGLSLPVRTRTFTTITGWTPGVLPAPSCRTLSGEHSPKVPQPSRCNWHATHSACQPEDPNGNNSTGSFWSLHSPCVLKEHTARTRSCSTT